MNYLSFSHTTSVVHYGARPCKWLRREERTVSHKNMKTTTAPALGWYWNTRTPSRGSRYLLGWTIIWDGTIQGNFLTEVGVVAVFLVGSLCFLLLLRGQGGGKATFTTATIAFNETQRLGQTSREQKKPRYNSSLLFPGYQRNENNLKIQGVLVWFPKNIPNSSSLAQHWNKNDTSFETLHGCSTSLCHQHPTDNPAQGSVHLFSC